MSPFDPKQFLDAQTTESNEKRPLLPTENPDAADGLYTAVVGTIDTASGTIGKGEKIGKPWIQMLVPLRLQVPPMIQALGIPPEVTITDRPFLDLNDQGGEDNSKGKSWRKRAYRDATGQNKPGEPFAWRMLEGKVVKIKVAHEPYLDTFVERAAQILPS